MSFSLLRVGDDGLRPPLPDTGDNNGSTAKPGQPLNKKNVGQHLLALSRTLEYEYNQQSSTSVSSAAYKETVAEVEDIMNKLVALYARRGLLQSNSAAAQATLDSQKVKGRDKKPKKTSSSGGLQVYRGDVCETSAADSTVQQQEPLVLTAILRILALPGNDTVNREGFPTDTAADVAFLVALACEICISINQGARGSDNGTVCKIAEHEMLSQLGKSILSGIVSSLRFLYTNLVGKTLATTDYKPEGFVHCLSLIAEGDDSHFMDAIFSCLRAGSSLIGLLGNRFSRNFSLLTDLRALAWRSLALPNQPTQLAAARLLAILQSFGGNGRENTRTDPWSDGVKDTIWILSIALDEVAPLNKAVDFHQMQPSDDAQSTFRNWISFLKDDVDDEGGRAASFLWFMRGLTKLLQAFLCHDSPEHRDLPVRLDARVDVESIFQLLESLLSFPISAETIYLKTKKRLRHEPVEGGILSPTTIATHLAPHLKVLGHQILDCLVSNLGGPVLLPFSRRIYRISYASLLTSCSVRLRKVMDPNAAISLGGKKRRWMQSSVSLRGATIRTVQKVMDILGPDSSKSTANESVGEMAAALVCGCLVEQASSFSDNEHENWGSTSERIELVAECSDCLRAALLAFGGWLSLSVRSLIDSTVAMGLNGILESSFDSVFVVSQVKIALFELSCACLTTPWIDGTSTGLLQLLVSAAKSCKYCSTDEVTLSAEKALRTAHALQVSRAPALLYVSRASAAAGTPTAGLGSDALNLVNHLKSALAENSEGKEARKTKRLKGEGTGVEGSIGNVKKPRQQKELFETPEILKGRNHDVQAESLASEKSESMQGEQTKEASKDSAAVGEAGQTSLQNKGNESEHGLELTKPAPLPQDGDCGDVQMSNGSINDEGGEEDEAVGEAKDDDSPEDEDGIMFPEIVDGNPDSDDE